jgi:hypothetical protein
MCPGPWTETPHRDRMRGPAELRRRRGLASLLSCAVLSLFIAPACSLHVAHAPVARALACSLSPAALQALPLGPLRLKGGGQLCPLRLTPLPLPDRACCIAAAFAAQPTWASASLRMPCFARFDAFASNRLV